MNEQVNILKKKNSSGFGQLFTCCARRLKTFPYNKWNLLCFLNFECAYMLKMQAIKCNSQKRSRSPESLLNDLVVKKRTMV